MDFSEHDSLREKSRSEVDRLINELEDKYGEIEVLQKVWGLSEEEFEAAVEEFRNGGRGGAGIWLRNDDGQVLLVRNKGDDAWGDLGGHHEKGESFEEAAIRETREESNVEAEITGIKLVDWVEMKHQETGKLPHNLPVVFEGRCVGGSPEPQERRK
jgi:8-oxo-dGTP pyrophosphatase MutT (NUDIX family)